jgi:hypothetical protein
MTPEEVNALAATLAYEFCVSVIECNCTHRSFPDDGRDWWELEDMGTAEGLDHVVYLEARGLLQRHPENNTIATILDEDA